MAGGTGGRESTRQGEQHNALATEEVLGAEILPTEGVRARHGLIADTGFEHNIGDTIEHGGDFLIRRTALRLNS
jgi:hypothetical protein